MTIIDPPTPRKVQEAWRSLRPPHATINKTASRKPTVSRHRAAIPRFLPEPIECPYLGERRLQNGEPESIKCGCSQNLVVPVYQCEHPDKIVAARTTRSGKELPEQPGRCLPTIGYRPPESHAPKAYYTPCVFCPLNPNYKEPHYVEPQAS